MQNISARKMFSGDLERCWFEESMSKRRRFLAHQNYIEKVRRNDIKIYRYFLLDISFLFLLYRRNIDIESMLIRRGLSIA